MREDFLDFRRARQPARVDQDVDRLLQPHVVDIAEADLGDLGWFISSLSVASKRSCSTAGLISGSRLATDATAIFGSLSESITALLSARTKPRTTSGFSLTSFLETMMALE